MRLRIVAFLVLGGCLLAVAASGSVAADPGQHEVEVTDGDGNVNETYHYEASTGSINVSHGDGTWTNATLANTNESALAIQWALDNSTGSYDTVLVGSGTYSGSVQIDEQNRSIIGVEGPTSTVLQPRSSSDDIGLTVDGSGSNISGLTITGFDSAGNAGISVEAGTDDTTVRNSSFTHLYKGVKFGGYDTNNSQVHNNTFRDVSGWTVQVDGGVGVIVSNNEFDNDGDFSVFVRGGSDHVIEDNWIHNSSYSTREGEIGLGGTTRTRVTNNTIEDSRTGGIQLFSVFGTPTESKLENNTVRNADGNGIVLTDSDSTVLRHNTLSNNTEDGLRIATRDPGLEITGTEAYRNDRHGIYVESASDFTIESSNTSHNGESGVRLQSTDGATLRNPKATDNTGGIDMQNADGSAVVNGVAWNNTDAAVYIDESSNSAIRDSTMFGSGTFNETGIVLGSNTANITVTNNVAYNFPAAIAADGNGHRLTGNTVNGSLYGIVVSGTDVKTVGTLAENNTAGFLLENAENTTVRDVRISDGYAGLVVNNSSHPTLDNASVTGANSTGIEVDETTDATIDDSTVRNGSEIGIHLNRSDGAVIHDTTVTGHDESGIHVESTPNATIRQSSILGNNRDGLSNGGGIFPYRADGLLVEDVVVRHNREAGIDAWYANDTTIADSRITENCGGDVGVSFRRSSDMLVTGTNVSNNTGDGLYLEPSASNLTVRDSRFNDNGGIVGLHALGRSTIVNVTANGNNVDGVYVGDGSAVTGLEAADNGKDGLSVGANVIVVNASSTGNGADGLSTDENATLIDSVSADNGESELTTVGQVGPEIDGTNLTLGSVTFARIEGSAISYNATAAPAPSPPSDTEAVGEALNVTLWQQNYFANVSIGTDSLQTGDVDASTLALYRYNATGGEWEAVSGSTFDAGAGVVSANVTTSGEYRLHAEPTSSGGGDGGSGGGFVPPPSSGGSSDPAFNVSAVDLSTAEVPVGEPVTVTVDVDNDGGADGEYTATLTADGDRVDSETASINANWHETFALSTSFDQPGTYQLAVDGESAGSVEVTGEPDVGVDDVALSETEVSPGYAVTITATVTNDGAAEGSFDAPLLVDGQQVDSRTVPVAPGESETVTFEHLFEESGSQSVTVGGQEAGTVDVAAQEPGESGGNPGDSGGGSDDGESDGSGSGGGLGLVPVLLGGVLLVGGSAGVYFREELRETIDNHRN